MASLEPARQSCWRRARARSATSRATSCARQEAHQENVAAGQLGRGRKRDHVDLGIARHRLYAPRPRPRAAGRGSARAPPTIAERAASAALSAVPPLSRGTRVSRSLPVANNASCAASSIALPRSALGPDSGTSSATLTGPAAAGGRGSAADTGGGGAPVRPTGVAARRPAPLPSAGDAGGERGSSQRRQQKVRRTAEPTSAQGRPPARVDAGGADPSHRRRGK